MSETAEETKVATPERWGEKTPGPHPLTRRGVWLPIVIALLVLNIPFFHLFLYGAAKTTTTVPFTDDFNRAELGDNYFSTGGFWRIVNGEVYSPGTRNNPLWLRAKLPHDVVVEFDVRADSIDGDVKCEIFGNGKDHSSGYLLVFGGWHNTISTIARLYEHGADVTNMSPDKRTQTMQNEDQWRVSRNDVRVDRGHIYHWKVVRQGSVLTWYIDGQQFLQIDDPHPLYGSKNDRFAFGTWASDAYFDNLTIRPL